MIVAVPALSPVANPLRLTDATAFGDDDQVTVLVRSLELPLLQVPVAVNCSGLSDDTSVSRR